MEIGALLALIGQGLLTGIGSGTTSWVMGRILSAIFGSSSDSELMQAVQQIQIELQQIAQAIQQILQEITQLSQQLALDTTILENYIQQAAINEDISIIEQHYSDMQTMNSEAANQTPLIYDPHTFAKLVTQDWDIGAHVEAISNALLGNEGLSDGLLSTWTTYFMQEMGSNAAPGVLANYAALLQKLFEQQLQHQFKGVALMTGAISINCDPNQKCQPGLDYLTQFNALLAQQVERYLECVERMVLSQYNVAVSSQQPSFPKDGPGVFASADLYAAVALNQTPGLRGRVLLPPTGKAPALQPSSAYASSSGTLVQTPSGYKCADWAAVHQLLGYENSDFQVIRYAWAWPQTTPPVGAPINPGFENGVAPGYWDTTTCSPVSAPNANTVVYANFTDISAVATHLDSTLTGWQSTTNTNAGAQQNISAGTSYPTPNGIAMSFVLSNNQLFVDPDSYEYSASQWLTISYAGSDQPTLEIPFEVTLSFQNYEITNAMSQTERFLTSVRAGFSVSSEVGGGRSLYDSGVMNDSASGTVTGVGSIATNSSSPVTLCVTVVATANEYFSSYGNIPVGAGASISLQVNFNRVSWPMPAPGATAPKEAQARRRHKATA
jgi:hypothetical protein